LEKWLDDVASIATDNFKITRVIILATPKRKLTVTEHLERLLQLHPNLNVVGVHSQA
jgi:hypothetical protein